MNDLATLNGKPRTLKVDGRDYRFYPLTLDDLGGLQAWVDAQTPDPFTLAYTQINTGRFTVDQCKFMLKTAMEMAAKGSPKLGTDEADLMLQSADGVKEVLFLSVRKGDPAFSREDAAALFRKVTQGDVAALFRTTGLIEAGVTAGADADPNAWFRDPEPGGGRTPVDWWRVYHRLTAEEGWHPEAVGRLTVAQLICMGNPDPPGDVTRFKADTFEAYQRAAEIAALDRESWAFDRFGAMSELLNGD